MKELIQCIAKALVDNPDQVVVEEITTQQTLVLELRVAKEDIGKVIGKKGSKEITTTWPPLIQRRICRYRCARHGAEERRGRAGAAGGRAGWPPSPYGAIF